MLRDKPKPFVANLQTVVRRKAIEALRREVNARLDAGVSARSIQYQTTRSLDVLLAEIISTSLLQETARGNPPPCQFTAVALGSYGRSEMCPYSDLDFGILLDERVEDPASARRWFRVVAIGWEEEVRALGEDFEGIRFCDGGMTPSGTYSAGLIGTPSQLASVLTRERLNGHDAVTRALMDARPICGTAGEDLYARFVADASHALATDETDPFRPLMDEAVHYLKRCSGSSDGVYNAKWDLRHGIDLFIKALAARNGSLAGNAYERVERLERDGVLHPQWAARLCAAANLAGVLRMRAQLHHRGDTSVFHEATAGADSRGYPLTQREQKLLESVREAYSALAEVAATKDSTSARLLHPAHMPTRPLGPLESPATHRVP